MRTEGKIVSWNKDKRFGFIQPNNSRSRIFIHLSAIKNSNTHPEINQSISYIPATDKQDRPCAKQAFLKQASFTPEKNKNTLFFSWIFAAVFIAALTISVLTKITPPLILAIYLIASIAAYIAYAIDKSAAKNGGWRTSESSLHLLSLIGGWPGAILAQNKLRHKATKEEFRFVFWLTVALNIGILSLYLFPDQIANLSSQISRII